MKYVILLSAVFAMLPASINSQSPPAPPLQIAQTPALASVLAKKLDELGDSAVSQERRRGAYAKLLAGQRHIWTAGRLRSQAGISSASRLAQSAFREAAELNPKLAEAYTALAELALNIPPGDLDEAINLAALAVRVEPNNYGSRRILARLYTFKSKLNTEALDPAFSAKAIEEWKYLTGLDPRNPEAWAFLSAFYEKSGNEAAQIDSLKKWLGSATPLDTQFYKRYMGSGAELTAESATLKLAATYLKSGRTREAIETLSVALADDAENTAALELLSEAVESAEGETASLAVESLQQAVFANPANIALLNLLAETYSRGGRIDDAVKLLRDSSVRLAQSDRSAASTVRVALGDLFARADRFSEALSAYEESIKLRGIDQAQTPSEDDREFAMYVFEKMIQTLKAASRTDEVRGVIERARRILGKDDLFADRQLISFYRESGDRQAALDAVREARLRVPGDYGFVRLEATLLTELGRVDEAVSIVRNLMTAKEATPPVSTPAIGGAGTSVSVAVPMFDDFSNYLFISNLYTEAGRPKEAADAANQAYSVARGSERKQIARLTLATAQQSAQNFDGAELTLRAILKDSPGNPIALNNLGYFLLERNERLQEALELIQQAVKVDPTNPSYLDSLGWGYYKLGRFDEAEKHLKDAARFDSGSSTILEHLGDVYLKQQKNALARSAWEKALKLASSGADIGRIKGKLSAIAK